MGSSRASWRIFLWPMRRSTSSERRFHMALDRDLLRLADLEALEPDLDGAGDEARLELVHRPRRRARRDGAVGSEGAVVAGTREALRRLLPVDAAAEVRADGRVGDDRFLAL